MDYFQVVPLIQLGLGPEIAGDDIAIQFHRDAVRLHAKFLDQSDESERRRDIDEIALFSIDLQFHRDVGRVRALAELYRVRILFSFAQDKLSGGRAPFEVRLHEERGIQQ